MRVLKDETMPLRTEYDVVSVRQLVRAWAVEAGLGLVARGVRDMRARGLLLDCLD